MDLKNIAKKIIALKDADLKLRDQLIQKGELGEGYHAAMETLHTQNAKTLAKIIDHIGYPTIDKVGQAASEAAWLLIQHSIGHPHFMKRCVQLLETAVQEQKAAPRNLAYLIDRIAFYEGKPQLYGTQFDWDKNGKMSPQAFDDLTKVNQRRKAIGLNTLEEQTQVIRARVARERQKPPEDSEKRKRDFEEWRKKVGWI